MSRRQLSARIFWIPFIKYRRKRYEVGKILKDKKNPNKVKLSTAQKKEVKRFWSKYKQNPIDSIAYYSGGSEGFSEKYISNYLYMTTIDPFFNDPEIAYAWEDKNLQQKLIKSKTPYTVARKINGVYLNKEFEPIKKSEFLNIIKNEEEVILKVSIGSCSGSGIHFWNSTKDSISNLEMLESDFDNLVIQRILKQHKDLAAIHESSLNTVRVLTINLDEKIQVVSSVVRMGVGDSRIDNCDSGGIVSGIDKNGCMKNVAYDGNGKRFDIHPQGYDFRGREVPSFEKIIETVKTEHYSFPHSKIIAWDVSVDENGAPVIIEANLSRGSLDFHQYCNGPLFGENTEYILDLVFKNNKMLDLPFVGIKRLTGEL
ncbi:sugar-transfer associated ATP-grasp domain-containing protein [Vagococcus fluvialis]|uniref:sugar-transfer associated ATP-grasp domain-containing protein n=1 Tax=Vagococcus fluvialis TaxID=2738 RepID=UPI003B21AA7A